MRSYFKYSAECAFIIIKVRYVVLIRKCLKFVSGFFIIHR